MTLTPINLDVLERVLNEHVGGPAVPDIFAAYDEAIREAGHTDDTASDPEPCTIEPSGIEHGRQSWTTAQVLPADLSELDAILLPSTGWREVADIWTDADVDQARRDFASDHELLDLMDKYLRGDGQHVIVRYWVERASDEVTDGYHVFRRPQLVTVRVPAARVPAPPFQTTEAAPHPGSEHPGDEDTPTQDSVTLVLRHADYTATWRHGDDHVRVWLDVDDWDNFPDRVVAEIPTHGRRSTARTLAELTGAWLNANPDALISARAEQASERS